jgi:hypothetical protein
VDVQTGVVYNLQGDDRRNVKPWSIYPPKSVIERQGLLSSLNHGLVSDLTTEKSISTNEDASLITDREQDEFLDPSSLLTNLRTKVEEMNSRLRSQEFEEDRDIRGVFEVVRQITDEYMMYLWDESVVATVDDLIETVFNRLSEKHSSGFEDDGLSRFVVERLGEDSPGLMSTIDKVMVRGYAKNALSIYLKSCEDMSTPCLYHEVSNGIAISMLQSKPMSRR